MFLSKAGTRVGLVHSVWKYASGPLNVGSTFSQRYASNSPSSPNSPKTPQQERQAAQLAVQSLQDMGSLLSSGDGDVATQPIDTAPIYSDNTLFGSLSLLHQGQVLKELQDKFDKKWHKLTIPDKKLAYYIAYGNWGVREDFSNWKSNEAPFDLPFSVPSKVSDPLPSPTSTIKKLEPVVLAETPVRRKQFDLKRVDAVTKVFIYLTGFVIIAALFRDKLVGEEGKPVETKIDDPYEIDRIAREQERIRLELEEQEKAKLALQRKWYYLWLK